MDERVPARAGRVSPSGPDTATASVGDVPLTDVVGGSVAGVRVVLDVDHVVTGEVVVRLSHERQDVGLGDDDLRRRVGVLGGLVQVEGVDDVVGQFIDLVVGVAPV